MLPPEEVGADDQVPRICESLGHPLNDSVHSKDGVKEEDRGRGFGSRLDNVSLEGPLIGPFDLSPVSGHREIPEVAAVAVGVERVVDSISSDRYAATQQTIAQADTAPGAVKSEEEAMRLGIDIGGTFTDVVLVDKGGAISTEKVLSTPSEPLDAVLEGLRTIVEKMGASASDLESVVHGTTIVPNAVIEQKGAVTALVTTRGFRDVIEIGREWRYDIYDLFLTAPPLLVPRPLRFEVTERVAPDGSVVTPLDVNEVERIVAELPNNVRSVAVCFLHSYANRAHEVEAARRISELRPDLFVTVSSDLSPEIREYERFSTAVVNAYVQPLVKPYLDRLASRLRKEGVPNEPNVVLSNGGVTVIEDAARYPVRMVESGPSAGVMAAAYFGRSLRDRDVLAFDMGGTTAKASFLEGGKPSITRVFEVARSYRFKPGSGIPLNVTTVDLIEIGAGGGSIARVDELGRLKVGPDSSGADPGPACYDRGGQLPTVTDADLLLGYLDAATFLGGTMPLSEAKARAAMEAYVAAPLKLDPLQAAWAVHRLINEGMANAVRIHAAERGKSVSTCAMVPFGGAAGLHACHVSELLGIKRVMSPMRGSVLSAFGMLVSPLAFDTVRTHPQRLDRLDFAAINRAFDDMLQEGRALMAASGAAASRTIAFRTCDMQFVGQGHTLTIELPTGPIGPGLEEKLKQRFERRYRTLHRRLPASVPIEVVNWRTRVSGPDPKIALPEARGNVGDTPTPVAHRTAIFEGGNAAQVPVYIRSALASRTTIEGPAIVVEPDTSVVIPPGWEASVDLQRNMIIENGRAS